jgi:hypothetical protein
MNGGNVISPLRAEALVKAPDPHHPDQAVMFPSPVDTTFSVTPGEGSAVSITIRFHRTERRKCSACQKRRICFYIGLADKIMSPPMCARCFGVR